MKKKQYVYDYLPCEISQWFNEQNERSFRARQLCTWLYEKKVLSWQEMRNIPQTIREKLIRVFTLYALRLVEKHEGKAHDAVKYLFKTCDNEYIEAVLITKNKRHTVCVSTQIGCKMQCAFCASGQAGFVRNLSCAEIVEQIVLIARENGKMITNVVFMGMGEPLDNYKNTIQALRLINDPAGLNISERHITISTVGMIPQMRKLIQEKFSRISFSLSLHATTNSKRKQLLPIANKYSLDEVIAILSEIRKEYKRHITLEYILLPGINNSSEDVRRLGKIAKKIKAKINIIGYNPVSEALFQVPTKKDMNIFAHALKRMNIETTIRYSAGVDIAAACGQLRLRKMIKNDT